MSVQNDRKKVTVPDVMAMKKGGRKIAMLTAYDALMAHILDQSGIDIILVGDSGGMVMGGKSDTLAVTMEDMLFYTRSVRRGVQNALLVADMPFMSYQASTERAMENAGRFLQECGAEAVKIEGGRHMADTIRALVDVGIPVMGHLGLTPQSIHRFGGFKLRAREEAEAKKLVEDAQILQEAGVFSIVLEKIPARLAHQVSASLKVPTIGIGAGAGCDGQVLVTHDMLGLFTQFRPKFVRRYAEMGEAMEKAVRAYIEDVRNVKFPSEDESY